jgi:Glycosyl transferases group 1
VSLERYVDLATWGPREFRWRLSAECRTGAPIHFPLDPAKVRDMQVRWPKTYQWPPARRFVSDIASGLKRFVPVRSAELPQPAGIVMIQVCYRSKVFDVAIDYSDYLDRIDSEVLKRSALYFKMQYRRDGYGFGKSDSRKLVPGGYVNGHPELYHYLPHVRRAGSRDRNRYDVFGRYGLDFAKDIRRKAVELLREQSDFRYSGGLKKVRYSCFLMEAAQSKICIDLPGNGDFCFRLVDYLAVGSCIIGPRHRTTMHVPMDDRKHIVYTKDDLSDLIPLCKYYLEHKEEREEIQQNAYQYFERYLHREQLAAYYLHQCLTRLDSTSDGGKPCEQR